MKLEIKNQHITIVEREPLISGTVNVYTVEFSFDSAWDGYTPVAVFAGTGVMCKETREQAITGGRCTIPWETLLPNGYLRIGVYGVSGDKRLPTIYTDRLFVVRGTEPAEEAAEPTPGVVEQIVSQVAADRETATSAAAQAQSDADKAAGIAAEMAALAAQVSLDAETASQAQTGSLNAQALAETAQEAAETAQKAAETAAGLAAQQAAADVEAALQGCVSDAQAAQAAAEAARDQTQAIAGRGFMTSDVYDPQGKAQDVYTYADKQTEAVLDRFTNNYTGAVGSSIAVAEASESPLKSLIVTANTSMPNTGNADAPVSLGYSSGIKVTYPDGVSEELAPAGKLYAINAPYGSEIYSDKRDWGNKKDIRRIYHYVFTGDERFYDTGINNGIFSLADMSAFEVPYMVTSKVTIRCSHWIGGTYDSINGLKSSAGTESIDKTIAVYGGYNASTQTVTSKMLLLCDRRFSTSAELQTYLKQQFNNGTPVEIAYITGWEYEEDIPETDHQLYRDFTLKNPDCIIANNDGCDISCEWWKNFPLKNYIDWSDALKSGLTSNSRTSTSAATPEMYGAVGDGVSDDTTAIQTAVDTNDFVLLTGNYKIGSVTVSGSDKIILSFGEIRSSADDFAIKIIGDSNYLQFNRLLCNNGIDITGSHNRVYGNKLNFDALNGVKVHPGEGNSECNDVSIATITGDTTTESIAIYVLGGENSHYSNEHTFHKMHVTAHYGIYTENVSDNETLNDNNLFSNIDPEHCVEGVVIKGNVKQNNFDFIRDNEFVPSTADTKTFIHIIGSPRFNVFKFPYVIMPEIIKVENYTGIRADGLTYFCPNILIGGLVIGGSQVWKYGSCELVNTEDGSTVCLMPEGNHTLRGEGTRIITDDLTIGYAKNNDMFPEIAYRYFRSANSNKSCVLTLPAFKNIDYYFVVEPEYPPIIVRDSAGETIFDLTGTEITEKAMYKYHGEIGIVTKETILN